MMYYKPRIDDSLLAEYSDGLIATSACLGSYSSQLILKGEVAAAEKLLDHHAAMFKDRFFIEVQLHEMEDQQVVNKALVEIARKRSWPLLLTNDCLLPGQPIMTLEGMKEVQDITFNDLVLTHTGNYEKVVVPVSKQIQNETIYHLNIKQSKKTVSLTGEHPLLISDISGTTTWKKAKDIRPGDLATFPRQKQRTQLLREPNFSTSKRLDHDLAWLLGWFTAEGSTWIANKRNKNGGTRSGFNFALSLQEEDIAINIIKIIKKKWGYEPKLHIRRNWIEVRGYNQHIPKFFAYYCGIGSRNKFIHPLIQASNHLKTYLSSLFQGDGTATRTSQLATASIQLAYGVKQALATVGYWGNVSHINRKCQTGVFKQYLISWTPDTQHKKWLVFPNFIARAIQSIETEIYTGLVYNFEVDKDNTYVSEVTLHNCHYTQSHDKALHEAALCMQTSDVLSNPKRFSFGDIDVHVAHHDWMWEHAQKQGIPYEAISNTLHIAKMINHESYYTDRKNRYPIFQGDTGGLPHWEALEVVAQAGLAKKLGTSLSQEYRDRLDHELHVIKKMGFYDYFLITKEIIDGARSEDVWVGAGRGSAAGSLVAFALDITKVDPLKYGLVFERFLNPGRSARPLHFDVELVADLKGIKSGSSSPHIHSTISTSSRVVRPDVVERERIEHLQLPPALAQCLHNAHSVKI